LARCLVARGRSQATDLGWSREVKGDDPLEEEKQGGGDQSKREVFGRNQPLKSVEDRVRYNHYLKNQNQGKGKKKGYNRGEAAGLTIPQRRGLGGRFFLKKHQAASAPGRRSFLVLREREKY